jgi:hypothetical protein
MTGRELLALIVCVACGATSVAMAQAEPDASRSTEPPKVENVRTVRDLVALSEMGRGGALGASKVTLEVVDTPVVDVLRGLEVMLRQSAALKYPNLPGELLRFEVAPEVQGSVTMCLHNVSLKTTLAALCESVGCVTATRIDDHVTWVVAPMHEGGNGSVPPALRRPLTTDLERQVGVNVTGALLSEFLPNLVGIEGLRTDVTPEVASRRVTIEYRGTLRGALDELCERANCAWRVEGAVVHFEAR